MPGYSLQIKNILPARTDETALTEKAQYNYLILFFVALKIVLNLLSITHFGLQRDELLYVVLGEHLNWGFKEVSPFIALLAKLSTIIFGNSLFATRLFSTVFGGLIILFTGKIVQEFGGGKFTISLACLALICSPAFAASGYLFEPVVYDQFWWVLTVWLLIRYLKTSSVKYLYTIGIATGIGLLTKYSMVFFSAALITGLLLNGQGKILWSRPVLKAVLLTFLLILPNVVWEIIHHVPVITQMNDLETTQLNYITPVSFVLKQLVVNGISLLLWVPGLIFLLFNRSMRQFRFMAFAYIFVFLLLLILRGKDYYMLGAYPMLFAAGAYGIEKWVETKSSYLQVLIFTLLFVPNLVVFPMVQPILTRDQTLTFFNFECRHVPFLLFAAKWDDNKMHPLTQNYGVMIGWDEMARKVARIYYNLSPVQQKHTLIYAGNYGEASSLYVYGKKYNLPEVVSLNSSFSLWAPSKIKADYIIYVDDKGADALKKMEPQIESWQQLDEITDPLAVENGTGIFLLTHPKPAFFNNYQKEYAAAKLR